MAQMKITHAQAQAFLAARALSKPARSAEKRRLFAEIRRVHNLPLSQNIKVWVEDPGREDYCVIRDKRTGKPLDNGIPEKAPVMAVSPAAIPAPVTTAPAAFVPTPVAPVVPVAATKKTKVTPVTAKTPAKKTKVTPVTAAKAPKVAVKVPAKKVKVAEVKAAVKAPAVKKVKGVVSATKTATATIEVRATIGGKRQRLGWVSSEEMKAKVIAKAKVDQLAATAA